MMLEIFNSKPQSNVSPPVFNLLVIADRLYVELSREQVWRAGDKWTAWPAPVAAGPMQAA
jgi:hypothetical protein